jgi:hypothetical protein
MRLGLGLAAGLLAAPLPAGAGESAGLVVHEWGTFTSFSGADGALLDFATTPGKDLPSFVYTRESLEHARIASRGKSAPARERMETPVVYFYSEAPREVEVEVRFPKGVLTEFYPHVRDYAPRAESGARAGGLLRWGKVKILPGDAAAASLPGLAPGDDRARAEHYLYARETDAALVRVCAENGDNETEAEKFLFYRGVGSFELPVAARALGGGRVALQVDGAAEIARALVLEVADDGRARLAEVDLAPRGRDREVALPADFRPAAVVGRELEERLLEELEQAGLFEKEARAMVKTWRASYFASAGLRVLYVLPRAFTDEVLPLSVKPAPDALVRVLLGRMEVLTPEREAAVAAALRGDSAAAREAALGPLGRYAAAAVERVVAASADEAVRRRGRALLEEMGAAGR